MTGMDLAENVTLLYVYFFEIFSPAVAQWLGCCATNRKVADSNNSALSSGLERPHSERSVKCSSSE